MAKVYRLRSVGGASAGAIAAAAAAAAEVGRPRVRHAAVRAAGSWAAWSDELTEEQPDGKSRLFHLFRPQRSARRLFGLLVAGWMDAAAFAAGAEEVAGTVGRS